VRRFLLPSILLLLLLAACGGERVEMPHGEHDTTAAAPRDTVMPFGPADTTLNAQLRAIEARSGGHLGLAAIRIENGWRTSYRGAETFPMASVAKLPMAIRLLRLVDSGAIRLDSVVTLTDADHRPGASILFHRAMRQTGQTTVHDLLNAMITASDNTAADYLLRLAGGPPAATATMRSIGLGRIDVSHYEGELILDWAGIDPHCIADSGWTRDRCYAKIAEMGDSALAAARARLVDAPTDAAPPEQMAQLLTLLQQRRLLGAATSDTLLGIMSRTVTGRSRIPGLLPAGTVVAHKTGTISSTANDVGIITLPNGEHLALAIFVKGSSLGVHARERAIAEAASLIVRKALGSTL
jgi:beta-lactamase class A